jgi:di/tricarboxylate transporter
MLSGLNNFSNVKNFASDVLTFSHSKYRFFSFVFILVFLFLIPLNFLEALPNFSICSYLFKDYCYSVGLTRGVASLLKGNFVEGLEYNLLSVPVLIILVAFIVYDFFKIFGNLRKKN